MQKNNLTHRNIDFLSVKKDKRETRFSHIAMCVNASETPFLSSIILCFYVLKYYSQ